MDKKTKNHGKSIRAKLLNVAKEEGVFYQTVLTRYFQERLLYRLSQTRYRVNFYLKGGALMFAYDRFAARPTFDVISWVVILAMRVRRLSLLSRRYAHLRVMRTV